MAPAPGPHTGGVLSAGHPFPGGDGRCDGVVWLLVVGLALGWAVCVAFLTWPGAVADGVEVVAGAVVGTAVDADVVGAADAGVLAGPRVAVLVPSTVEVPWPLHALLLGVGSGD